MGPFSKNADPTIQAYGKQRTLKSLHYHYAVYENEESLLTRLFPITIESTENEIQT